MEQKRPLLIVLSSTRNYGWCTRAFLEVNTKWADYVIIVDQMSTDGTREMCAEYKNVILVDDPDLSYHEATRSKMLIDRAREIPGDKIFFVLAIDEVMPANMQETKDWQRIINSKPGEFFLFKWANLLPDDVNYEEDTHPEPWMYRVLHDDGVTPYKQTQQIHAMTLPYPSNAVVNLVNDFPILHFGHGYYTLWNTFKVKYYQMVDMCNHTSKSFVGLCRTYSNWQLGEKELVRELPYTWIDYGYNVFDLVDNTSQPYIINYMKELITQHGLSKFAKLNIWDNSVCTTLGVKNPQKFYHKLFHLYIQKTQPIASTPIIKIVDKFLKIVIK